MAKTCHAAVSKAYLYKQFAGPALLLGRLQQSCSPCQRAEAAAKLGSESSKLQRCAAGKALTGEATANATHLR